MVGDQGSYLKIFQHYSLMSTKIAAFTVKGVVYFPFFFQNVQTQLQPYFCEMGLYHICFQTENATTTELSLTKHPLDIPIKLLFNETIEPIASKFFLNGP